MEYDLQVPTDFFWGEKRCCFFFFPQSKIAIPTVIREIVFSSSQFSTEYCYDDTDNILSLRDVDEIAEFL